MQTISIDDVIIELDRHRKDLEEEPLKELILSILTLGLLHAPVMQNDGRTLVAGFRRFRAISAIHSVGKTFKYQGEDVPFGQLPVTKLGDLSEDMLKEAQLDENIKREPLTWQERAAAIADLHMLRERQAKKVGKTQTFSDTAKEIKTEEHSDNYVRNDVRAAVTIKAFEDDPEVMRAATQKEAIKIIEKKLTKAHNEALAKQFLTNNATPHELIKGNLLEVLPQFADGQFDAIIADPPYGQDADKGNNMSATKHSYQDDEAYSDKCIETIAVEGYRVAKARAHMYMFVSSNPNRQVKVIRILKAAGWDVWNTPFVWYKDNVGVCPRPDLGPRRSYESILYCIKGEKRIQAVYLDTFLIKHEKGIDYAAHKPAELYWALLSHSCIPGNKVLDPSCGSGPIFPAATKLNLIAVGIEMDENALGLAAQRLTTKMSDPLEDFENNDE